MTVAIRDMTTEEREMRKVDLLESVRHLCIAIIIGGLALAFLVWNVGQKIDTHEGNGKDRSATLNTKLDTLAIKLDTNANSIQAQADLTTQLRNAFTSFELNNQAYLDNHAKTQRLICYDLRLHGDPLPDNGDCDGR